MCDQNTARDRQNDNGRFFDGFTKTMLAVMFFILICIFVSGKYMSANHMAGGGTDDRVNDLATSVTHRQHHPFIDLPGDAEVGAFSVANFFAGLIVGYHWLKLFGSRPPVEPEKKED
jgi:cobalt/nickel transport protein